MKSDKKSFWKNLDDNAERWMLLVFYVVIVMTISVEVVRRFVLAYSSNWGEEVARYAFIYLAWIGAASAIKDRAHIRIDVILSFLSRTGKLLIYIRGDLVMLVISILAFYFSMETLLTSIKFGSVTHGLGISQAWFLAAVPLGFLLMLYRLLQSLTRDITALNNDKPIFTGHRLFD